MKNSKSKSTDLEQQILVAAERLFIENGFAGTSTTDIAREVGCNQALVHYYYRTKERLFQDIFISKMNMLLAYIDELTLEGEKSSAAQQDEIVECGAEIDCITVIEKLVDFYFAMLSANRGLPFFIMNELLLNKERRAWLRGVVLADAHRQEVYYAYEERVRRDVQRGVIRQIDPFQLLLNAISLTIMSFLTLPMYEDVLQKSPDEINLYLRERQVEVKKMLRMGLRP